MSDDYQKCPTCSIERLASTLNEAGMCPFCVEEGKTPPEAPPKYAEVVVRPRKAPEPPAPAPVKDTLAPPEVIPYTPPQFDKEFASASPQRELAMRELCRRRFLPFVQRFRPKYMAGWVHEDICRRLERFVEQVERGESPRLLLMMPPRSGKSELGSRHLPGWILGKHPDWEIIAASHTSSLTLSFSRYIRDLIRDPAYQVLFPDMRLDPASQSVENWNTLSGGGYLAAGVGTGITGRGAHILLLDDLVKDIEAADSVTIKENTWEWYGSTAYTRLAPGGGVLGIMTWWNEDDWAGRIQQVMASGDGDIFEVIRYPAINDEGDEYILWKEPGEPIVQIGPNDPIPEGATMTRPMGTAIHPARYTTEAMLRIKRNLVSSGQKRVWNALYQQNPTPDDGVHFSKEMIQYFDHPPQRHQCTRFQAWDFAITEDQKSDYTVCVTMDQDEHNSLYVIDVFRFRSDDGNAIVEHMIDQIETWKPDFLGVEDGQIWKTLKSQFETRMVERRVYQAYEVLQPLTDKIVRASPLKGRMQLRKVFIRNNMRWTEPFVRELMVFPGGKHDDQVDAASWCTRLTLNHLPKKPPPPKPPKSWRDKLNGIANGRGGDSHMAA
jgi:predicted phage terminase large subunit-like protein